MSGVPVERIGDEALNILQSTANCDFFKTLTTNTLIAGSRTATFLTDFLDGTKLRNSYMQL
jgi:hypothetical protein